MIPALVVVGLAVAVLFVFRRRSKGVEVTYTVDIAAARRQLPRRWRGSGGRL